jgi:PAS domain S-box
MLSVLFIDDQNPLLEVMHPLLERIGKMNVKTALNAKDGLELLKNNTFDAIVVDYDLPEISGIEFLKIIRSKGDTTPVIIFTGVGREYAAIEALNNGADFFMKKGEIVQSQLLDLVQMIQLAIDRRKIGRGVGTTQKILSDAFNFFNEAAYVIDREGKVIAWNEEMAKLSGVTPENMIGKGDWQYSIPFFGYKVPLLSDLIFQDDALLLENHYSVIEKNKQSITAWTKATPEEGHQVLLWMKSSALYDSKGTFIGVMGKIRDITEEMGAELLRKPVRFHSSDEFSVPKASPEVGLFDKVMGKAKSSYKKGIHLAFKEGKYAEAIPYFDRSLDIDPLLANVWHDRGVCFRELGRDVEALRNFENAVELAPDDEEFLFSLSGIQKAIGILRQRKDLIESAILVLNRIVEKNPNHADAWNLLGICSKELGKDLESRKYFEKSSNIIKTGKNWQKKRDFDI